MEDVVEIAVGIAIIAFQPELSGLIAAEMGTLLAASAAATAAITLASDVIAGVALGTVASVATQETARAFGNGGNFSWKEVWQSALLNGASAGISNELGIGNPRIHLDFIQSFRVSEEYTAGMQAFE